MKNKKIKYQNLQKNQTNFSGISKRGKLIIFLGIIVAISGYFVLSLTDPEGQNWASKLSPFLILGGYSFVGIGIITPDKQPV